MMAKFMGNKTTNLLKLVEERAFAKKAEEEKKKQKEELVPYLPKECISNILIRLPLESLQISRFVCKPWYNMINSSLFIDAHLGRSETVLIFITPILKESLIVFTIPLIPKEKPNTFSVEEKLLQLESVPIFKRPIINPISKYYIKYLEIKDGKSKIGDFNASCLGKIKATCNGLILLENTMKRGGLVVMNPVTRNLTALPLGTLYPSHKESYGIVLCHLTSEYKVVHLFRDELGFIGCEIINVGMGGSWRLVNGPDFGLFAWFGYKPVFAIGALHWVPQIDHSEFLVSMEINKEKFQTIMLPKTSRTHDGIVEMGELLCFVTHEEINQMDIWILKGLYGEKWIKQHSITVGCIMDMVPLFCSRINEEIIFKRDEDGSLYAYNFQQEVMIKVEMPNECSSLLGSCLPHVSSLITWCAMDNTQDF